ncbi:MAG: hypothetical protein WCH34_14505 [Bacteroidota bacterium]
MQSETFRRMIYTTNPVEALHRVMRKVTKSKGAWSNDKGLIIPNPSLENSVYNTFHI